MRNKIAKFIASGILGGGGGAGWLSVLLEQFPAGDDVGIRRLYKTSGSLSTYHIYKHLNDNHYWRIQTVEQDISAGNNTVVMDVQHIVTLYKAFNLSTTPAYTVDNAGNWTSFTGFPGSYPGGDVAYCNNTGSWAQMVFTGTTIGVASNAAATNLGISLVTIDDSNTLANLLPTAQDLVTAGTLDAAALVAGGGTLNPTDRVWDGYQDTADATDGTANIFLFADNLSNASHTIRLTVTGYKNTSSSNTYTLLHFFAATGPSARTSNNGLDVLINGIEVDAGTTWEISYSFVPYTGGVNWQWLGHQNQAVISTISIKMDDVTVSLDGANLYERVAGSEVVIAQVSSIRHPDTTTEDLGTYNLTHAINKTDGLTISHTVTWGTAGAYQTGYPCMMGVTHATFDRYNSHGNTESDLTAADDSNNFLTLEKAIWCWDYDGNVAAVMYIPDLSVSAINNWQYPADVHGISWTDKDATWKKAYAWSWQGGTFSENDVLESVCNYRVQWFPDGANASMTGLG